MIGKLKAQSVKCKVKTQSFPVRCLTFSGIPLWREKFLVLSFSFALCVLRFAFNCYAKEIAIVYTGETHAMLYPCNCPKESDGGVARRATLIKQLRKDNPHLLLLDSGGFFAGGLMDEYTQNSQLDMQRTLVQLKAMELMEYDAVAVGDDEFNFGREFLQENIAKANFSFLSGNISPVKLGAAGRVTTGEVCFKPYIIKEVEGIKIGIIGITSLLARPKAGGLEFIEPKLAVKRTVGELKKKGATLIVLLSHLGENEDLRLIEEVKGIDVLILAHNLSKEEPSEKIGTTIFLRPSWQGRRLNKLTLEVADNKIINYKTEEPRLSDKITDDLEVGAILPPCFADANCRKKGFIGTCQNPGSINSTCAFTNPRPVKLLIIKPKKCRVCDTEKTLNYLKGQFPGLVASYLNYPDAKAKKLISGLKLKTLPAYLLAKEIEKEGSFNSLKENLVLKGDFYALSPNLGGIAYFIERKNIKGKFDVFISLYDKNALGLLDAVKEFNPALHFLAVQLQDRFYTSKGDLEVEEYLRCVCVEKYYPKIFWNYLTCRVKNINSSWWEDCLGKQDTNRIKTCAKGEEGRSLLKENISLNKELEIIFGPTYLLDNQEIFTSLGVPKKEELKSAFNKK